MGKKVGAGIFAEIVGPTARASAGMVIAVRSASGENCARETDKRVEAVVLKRVVVIVKSGAVKPE